MRGMYIVMYMMVVAGCTESGRVIPGETSDGDTIMPDTETPDTDTLDTETRDTDTLDTETPDTDTPDTDTEASPDTSDTVPEPDTDTVADTAGCESFAITPEKTFLEPFGFAVFTAVGASEARRFDLVDDLTGASVHPTLGTFLAGPQSGGVQVRLRDPVCGERRALVSVVEPLELLPRLAAIEPATGHLQLEVVGGSGEFRFELLTVDGHPPVATLSEAGLLVAGPSAEALLVRVTDLGTGRTKTSEVQVRHGSTLAVAPAHLFLPLGESWRLAIVGGSGRIEATVVAGDTADIVTLEAGVVTALSPGRAELRIEDLHTGEVVVAVVEVLAAPGLALNPAGDAKLTGQILVADVDGDGLPEAIFGVAEADVEAYDGGAVFVYRGLVDGFELEPTVTLASPGRLDEGGASLALGDLDGDGLLDLVVGVPLSDEGGADRGAVKVYFGDPDTLFEEVASHTFVGETNGDQLGGAVGVCDFNGDGRLDLAMTARFAEDENQSPVASNAGALYIHLGYAEGFLRSPDQVVFGAIPVGDELVSRANLNLGRALATGDVDGDGRCDLVVTALAYSAGAGRTNDGAFMVYRGRGPDDFGPGGIQARPSLVVVGDESDAGGQLGLSAAMGDVDGDGLADILVGQPEYNRRVNAASRAGNGAAVLWPGRSVPTEGSTVVSVTTAPWRYVGRDTVNESGDRFGYAVAIGDLDGQPPLDLFIGARIDEQAPQCSSNCGTVHAIAGILDLGAPTLPSPLLPTVVYAGDRADQNFGSSLAPAPDFDGDGFAEVVTRAATDNRLAPRIGLHIVRPSTAATPFSQLSFSYASGGSRNGSALAVVPDLDGDGMPELAVGAWRSQFDPTPTAQHRPGEVALYRGHALGVAEAPFLRLGGFTGHTTSDAFGHAIGVTDADGDGQLEVAVVARLDDTGNLCSPARTDAGSIYLFERVGDGVSPTPMATLFGPQASQQIHTVVGTDLNGDGFGDVIAGGSGWDRVSGDNAGGVGIWWGGAGFAGNRCALDVVLLGANASDALGTAIEPLGDLNADGCADLAIGSPAGDPPGATNAGIVSILWGFGPGCAFASPMRSAFSPLNANAQAGGALSAADLDGDGLVELAVGARRFSNGVETVGAVWLVDGRYLRQLVQSASPWVDGVLPSPIAGAAPLGQTPTRLAGTRREEDFGAAVALLAGGAGEAGWLAVGRPVSDLSGYDGAGAVSVYEVRLEQAFMVSPISPVAIGGETRRTRSELGRNLIGWRSAAGRILAVGAGLSSAVGLDDGAVFVTRPR